VPTFAVVAAVLGAVVLGAFVVDVPLVGRTVELVDALAFAPPPELPHAANAVTDNNAAVASAAARDLRASCRLIR
jgi:hypothetical protein